MEDVISPQNQLAGHGWNFVLMFFSITFCLFVGERYLGVWICMHHAALLEASISLTRCGS